MFVFRFTIFIMVCLVVAVSSLMSPSRTKSVFSSLLDKIVGYSSCNQPCPPWKCQDDSAVIHGYCCHCPGSEYDNVPVPCYPDLKCPSLPQPLCSDYNFMMDCCCTGP